MCFCSSDYLWYPYYPEYHSYCYQNVISRDNTGPTPADNISWLGCIASEGENLNISFTPLESEKRKNRQYYYHLFLSLKRV